MSYVLYIKDGCELCEQFVHDLRSQVPELVPEILFTDITHQSELIGQVGDKIPLLTYNGETVCQYFFDVSLLAGKSS